MSKRDTLYDRWQDRYNRIESGVETSLYAAVLAKILRYLLHRYRNQPEAALPAAGPSAMPLWANERAIVVHQHLGRGQVAGVKTPAEAESRVTGVLARMANPQIVVQAPDLPADPDWQWPSLEEAPATLGRAVEGYFSRAFESYWIGRMRRDRWTELSGAITRALEIGFKPLDQIDECLTGFHVIPREAVRFLGACAGDTDSTCFDLACRAAELLARCENRSAAQEVLSAWRRRLAERSIDRALGYLEQYYLAHPIPSAEVLRGELASSTPLVRLRATDAVAELGTLEDVPLLADLLVVPSTDDEHPGERDALAKALTRLAERFPPERQPVADP
jgi:hypothetical protein